MSSKVSRSQSLSSTKALNVFVMRVGRSFTAIRQHKICIGGRRVLNCKQVSAPTRAKSNFRMPRRCWRHGTIPPLH